MKLKVSNIKLFIFDHDDTLVETIRPKWAQHMYITKEFYSRDLTEAEIKEHWGKPFTTLLRYLYKTDHIDIAMSYNIATRDMFPKKLFQGTLDTLRALKEKGKKLAILTSTTKASLTNDFELLGIDSDLFEFIQTEDDTEYHKPHPRVMDPIKKWIEKNGIDIQETVFIGDDMRDLNTAKNTGVQFIGVTTGMTTPADFKKHRVPYINGIADLLKTFK